MPLVGALPQSTGPYEALMIIGFVVAVLGHLSRSRWLVLIGIIMVCLGALAFPLALNLFTDKPEPPGPVAPSLVT